MSQRSRKSSINSVLLAEDHDVTRFGMAHFLRKELGVPTVDGHATFPDALTALNSKPFDLAVFDLHLPGLSSPAQLRDVRNTWPQMRVVVMSAEENRADILATLAAGAHGYILKATPMPEVATRLHYVMSGEIYVPSLMANLDGEHVKPPLGFAETTDAADTTSELTDRQYDVLEAMSAGLTNKSIAERLNLSEGTVKMHATGLFQKLGVRNRAQAVDVGQKYLRKRSKS